MPIESVLFEEFGLLYRRVCGTITLQEIEDDNVALYANPAYRPGTNVIIDDHRVMDFEFGYKEMFDFVERAQNRLQQREEPLHICFVGDRIMGRCVAKMFKSFSETRDSVMTVHTEMDLEEALTFLDVPLSVINETAVCNIPLSVTCAKDVPCDLPRTACLKCVG